MATWNRGRHIIPSIQSVLEQDFQNFEFLIVGDCVSDDTEQHLAGIDDPRIRWINLPERSGTQSGPNNRGLQDARAPIVAYCGHDDIWAPDHLARILLKYETVPHLDAVCSGIILYRRNAVAPYKVEGIFEDFRDFDTIVFTPPSGFSHRMDRGPIPEWTRREETLLSVDYEFQSQLAEAGFSFGSTGEITVHKWLASERYLDYFAPSSTEQAAVLAALQEGSYQDQIPGIVETAKATGFFLQPKPGVAFPRENRARGSDLSRGIILPKTRHLGSGHLLLQDNAPRGSDWHRISDNEEGFRWCGPSHLPRLHLPIMHDGPVRFDMDIAAVQTRGFPEFEVFLNATLCDFKVHFSGRLGHLELGRLEMSGLLLPDKASLLEFRLNPEVFLGAGRLREKAFALGAIRLVPELIDNGNTAVPSKLND